MIFWLPFGRELAATENFLLSTAVNLFGRPLGLLSHLCWKRVLDEVDYYLSVGFQAWIWD